MADRRYRVALQFNEYDFRHKKVLEILRYRPRHMTELVVNAIMHYVACPEAENEMTREWVRSIVREELASLQIGTTQQPRYLQTAGGSPGVLEEDLADLGSVMSAFRRGG